MKTFMPLTLTLALLTPALAAHSSSTPTPKPASFTQRVQAMQRPLLAQSVQSDQCSAWNFSKLSVKMNLKLNAVQALHSPESTETILARLEFNFENMNTPDSNEDVQVLTPLQDLGEGKSAAIISFTYAPKQAVFIGVQPKGTGTLVCFANFG